jgi:hypothetical protein
MRCRSIIEAVLLSMVILTQSASASTAQKLSLEELVKQADVIVRGRVAEATTNPSSDRGFWMTRVVISVDEQFKGRKVSSVTVTVAGGAMGSVAQGSPGTPEFSFGEDVVVFLRWLKNQNAYGVVGGKQGKFTAWSKPGSDQKIVEDAARRTESYENFAARLAQALRKK